MFGIGVQELAIIAILALLVFGPKRLPELARTVGKGLAEFRRASADLRRTIDLESAAPPQPPPPASEQDPRDERNPVDRPAQAVDGGLPDEALAQASGTDREDHEPESAAADKVAESASLPRPPDSEG